jgi:Zn-dependent metalloprotease
MVKNTLQLSLIAVAVSMTFAAQAQAQASLSGQREAIVRLSANTTGTSAVSINPATGAASFVRAAPGSALVVNQTRARAVSDASRQTNALQFISSYASLFGVTNAATELAAARMSKDQQGRSHITYRQVYQGVPVFAGELRAHFDSADNLTSVNGNFIPGIDVSTTPAKTALEAGNAATARVLADLGRSVRLTTSTPALMIYREGLAKGVTGANHLAWYVVVGNGTDVREFVYVDAHSGKVIDKFTGIHDAKNRRAFDGAGATQPGPNYPGTPFWIEGQPFPTGTAEADNMIQASSEIYDLFKNAFGRDSYDGNGARMDSIFNRGDGCPNASWGGAYISFCPGTTTDDVTAHEWGHAYTEYTDNLIYAWQPGALNESYSDIWGETVDRLNGRGGDTPDAARSAGACTVSTPQPPTVNITSPVSIAGGKTAGTAAFGAATFSLSGSLAGVQLGSTSAGCAALPAGSLTGKIAFVDRGSCGFSVKAQNAEAAGAIAVIIGNNQGGAAVLNMAATAGTTNTVPSLSVSQNDGTAIKAQLALGTVTATLVRGGNGTDSSVRWLIGEDSTAFGGAIRDMYNPVCYANPGKVSDGQYACGTADGGGVHSNSGVPNHGYALLVDGGTYNGQTITGIGLTKAAHIYYRAQSVYQGPATGFAAHADALAQSCTDLTGFNLNHLKTGLPSGEIISAADCTQVANTAAAVEFRTAPSQCNFAPLLAQSPPALCSSGTATAYFSDTFDGGKRAGAKWAVTHVGSTGDFRARDWGVQTGLPGGRAGYAIFATDPNIGTCAAGGDQSGLLRLESPEITVPADGAASKLSFDHYVATEAGYDGGNVKISVNGGAWQLITAANFIYNAYNATLTTAAAGSTNPLAGQAGFTGTDGGSVGGTWGRSIINLAPYATAGDKVKLRFESGTDGCGGTVGWYVDDVTVFRCTP